MSKGERKTGEALTVEQRVQRYTEERGVAPANLGGLIERANPNSNSKDIDTWPTSSHYTSGHFAGDWQIVSDRQQIDAAMSRNRHLQPYGYSGHSLINMIKGMSSSGLQTTEQKLAVMAAGHYVVDSEGANRHTNRVMCLARDDQGLLPIVQIAEGPARFDAARDGSAYVSVYDVLVPGLEVPKTDLIRESVQQGIDYARSHLHGLGNGAISLARGAGRTGTTLANMTRHNQLDEFSISINGDTGHHVARETVQAGSQHVVAFSQDKPVLIRIADQDVVLTLTDDGKLRAENLTVPGVVTKLARDNTGPLVGYIGRVESAPSMSYTSISEGHTVLTPSIEDREIVLSNNPDLAGGMSLLAQTHDNTVGTLRATYSPDNQTLTVQNHQAASAAQLEHIMPNEYAQAGDPRITHPTQIGRVVLAGGNFAKHGESDWLKALSEKSVSEELGDLRRKERPEYKRDGSLEDKVFSAIDITMYECSTRWDKVENRFNAWLGGTAVYRAIEAAFSKKRSDRYNGLSYMDEGKFLRSNSMEFGVRPATTILGRFAAFYARHSYAEQMTLSRRQAHEASMLEHKLSKSIRSFLGAFAVTQDLYKPFPYSSRARANDIGAFTVQSGEAELEAQPHQKKLSVTLPTDSGATERIVVTVDAQDKHYRTQSGHSSNKAPTYMLERDGFVYDVEQMPGHVRHAYMQEIARHIPSLQFATKA
ncbi:MAG: hypothetical protein AAF413_01765 [Patescibacteria group bacterium]